MIAVPMKVSVANPSVPMDTSATKPNIPLGIGAQYSMQSQQIRVDTTANWVKKTSYIPKKGEIDIYSDRNVIDGVNYPGVKVGDGSAYVVDLPFLGDDIADRILEVINIHITDSDVHVTSAEKNFWSNKLDCKLIGETLVLSPDYGLLYME